jgi:multidrug efflux pump
MRRSLGVAVFSGMLGVTLFGIFLTPVFYYVLQWFGRPPATTGPAPEAGPAGPPPAPRTGIQTRPDGHHR